MLQKIIISTSLTFALSSCFLFTPSPKQIGKSVFKDNGITAYIPPQGDPNSFNSWNNYGPGAIIRKNGLTTDYEAKYIIGEEKVQQMLSDAAPASTNRTPFHPLSNVTTSAQNFDASGGWTTAKAMEIKAQLGITESTTETIQFGETWVEQITLQNIAQANIKDVDDDTRLNLRQGKSHLVQKLIFSNGITIKFNKTVNNNAGATIVIPLGNQMKLGGSYHITKDGGVQVKGPVMIGYVPLDKQAAITLFPKKK